ncbi:MAG: archaellin/type IV pilin N-terminal domain-containing protein [Candidatus Aenigmatarchaeota archaeon]
MKKGISPLIAAVILIAFVIAVAGITSAFFTDISEDWGKKVEEEEPINCAVASIDIDGDTWSFDDPDGSITVFIEESPLSHLGVTVTDVNDSTAYTDFNAEDMGDDHPIENDTFQPGRSYRLDVNTTDGFSEGDIQSLRVTTEDCSVSDEVEF